MSFFELALIAVVAITGPLLALPRRWQVPVVLGELLAGVAVGRSGLGWVDPGQSTLAFLANVGFALMMFVAGTHVPLRDRAIRAALRLGAVRSLVAGAAAAGIGTAVALLLGSGHAPLFTVVMASSSAALVLPVITSLGLRGRSVLELTAQVAIADVLAIVALPLAINPGRAAQTAVGATVVACCALLLWALLRYFEALGSRRHVHEISEERKFALELRIQLSILFALAGLATLFQVSVMLAGFAFGLAVSAVGEPRRLAHQLFALNDGFLGPVFFVWSGAAIDLRELAGHPQMVLLGLLLGVGAIAAHATGRLTGLPLPFAVASAAQLGIPIAAATIGRSLGVLAPGEDAALLLGALITIASTTASASWAARRPAGGTAAAPPAAPSGTQA